MRALVIFLVLVPVLDLALLGHLIGFVNTVLLVLGTAMLGLVLIRKQGLHTLRVAQQKTAQGQLPLADISSGLFIGLAGLLFIHPGLITDLLALLCLIPWVRSGLVFWVLPRLMIRTGFKARTEDDVIEGEFQSVTDSVPTSASVSHSPASKK